MHLEQAAKTLFLVLGGVKNVSTGLGNTGINTEKSKLADERVRHDLECQRCERSVIISRASHFFTSIRINTGDSLNVKRRRHVIDHCVKQCLHTFILECRTTEDGVDLQLHRRLADSGLDFLNGEFFATEILVHQYFISGTDLFE